MIETQTVLSETGKFLLAMGVLIAGFGYASWYMFFSKKRPWNPPVSDFTELDYLPPTDSSTPEFPAMTVESTSVPFNHVIEPPVAPSKLLWDTPKQAYHSVRVICDEMGLVLIEKNTLCACIYQESRFLNTAVGKNKNSTDWGIVQVNDTKGWHIGTGLQFPSVQYVLENPEKCVRWMIRTYKSTGTLTPWASYTSGAYKQWLLPASPMWKLKS